MTFSWPSSWASPLCWIFMTQTVAEGWESGGVRAKRGRWEQNQTPLPLLPPQRKRNTRSPAVGLAGATSSADRACWGQLHWVYFWIASGSLCGDTAHTTDWIGLTAVSVNEHCYHTYRLKRIYGNSWSVVKPECKHNIYSGICKTALITDNNIYLHNEYKSCYYVSDAVSVDKKPHRVFF